MSKQETFDTIASNLMALHPFTRQDMALDEWYWLYREYLDPHMDKVVFALIGAEAAYDPTEEKPALTDIEILTRSAQAQMRDLIEQINQMRGMFPDVDGAIANAIADAEAWPSTFFEEGTDD